MAGPGLTFFDPVPELLIDDPQLRHVLDDPLALGIEAGLTPTGLGILHEVLPVPDQSADVELVVEDACAKAQPDAPAIRGVNRARPATHAELADFLDDARRRLNSWGIGPGDVVLMAIPGWSG